MRFYIFVAKCCIIFLSVYVKTYISFLNEVTRAREPGFRMRWMVCSAVEVVDMNIYSLRTRDSRNLRMPNNDGRCCRQAGDSKAGKQSRWQMLCEDTLGFQVGGD